MDMGGLSMDMANKNSGALDCIGTFGTSFGGFELGGEEREGEPAVLDHWDVGINVWPSVLIFHLGNIPKGTVGDGIEVTGRQGKVVICRVKV